MSISKKYSFVLLIAIVLLVIVEKPVAKSKAAFNNKVYQNVAQTEAAEVTALQERVTTHLSRRNKRRENNADTTDVLSSGIRNSDLLLLAKKWRLLSTAFKQGYLESLLIPNGLHRYETPGGHFEVLYSSNGVNMVDTSDTYGFSSDNWRNKTGSSNGVPDYIDEVGFALDSSWSMEIDRFGLVQPLVYNDATYHSDRYKVVVETQEESTTYAMTYPYITTGKRADNAQGFASYISLRNTWLSKEWSSMGYDTNYIDAIRVTCAHEFFHAIQYAMCWSFHNYSWLDDFPVSWTEGAAVCMEELAFSEVNDYHQYADIYFQNPHFSFLGDHYSLEVYTNAFIFIYLYHHIRPGGSISFVKSMLYNNYNNEQLPFDKNLLSAIKEEGSSWPKLLHHFHRSSFKTGDYADTAEFIPDAAYFSMGKTGLSDITDTIHATMAINSAYHVRVQKESTHSDTIAIRITASFAPNSAKDGNQLPLYSIRLECAQKDSFISIPSDTNGTGYLSLYSWKKWDELTVILTNANQIATPTVSIFIQTNNSSDTISTLTMYPNPLSLRKHFGKLFFKGKNIQELRLYSLNGNLIGVIYPYQRSEYTNTIFTWPIANLTDNTIVPGLYNVTIKQNNKNDDILHTTHHKLIITP